jgi:hypothetical protein
MTDALFQMEPLPRPERPSQASGRRWGGSKSTAARAHCRQLLAAGPVPCQRCGQPITSDDPESSWHAGHIEGHATGGSDSDPANFTPEHARCNMSDGGKLGARITNGVKLEQDWTRERTLRWW